MHTSLALSEPRHSDGYPLQAGYFASEERQHFHADDILRWSIRSTGRAEILCTALYVFGDIQIAAKWLSSDCPHIGASPINVCSSMEGRSGVMCVLQAVLIGAEL